MVTPANIRRPFKVEFIDGPLNGAIRYYSTLSSAKSVAKRYCSKPISGRCFFTYPCCEIFVIDRLFYPRLVDVILNED